MKQLCLRDSLYCSVLSLAICLFSGISCHKDTPAPTPVAKKTASEKTTDVSDSKTQVSDANADKAAMPAIRLTQDELSAGWIQLFDGQTLFGWKPNNDVNWIVSDGVITADAGEPGLLVTTVPFADYELRCDFRMEKDGNSGIFLRTAFDPKEMTKDCYEWNLCDSHESFPTGSFVGRQAVASPVKVEGEWHTVHIRAEGVRFVVALDGQQIMDFEDTSDGQVRSGFIGLQKNAGKIEFRNVDVRPLGTSPIFNGKDLTGWRVVPGSKSEFTVKDGAIHVTNGRGFLETEGTWDDFVLQFEAITNGDSLNSGVFFRAMPGTEKDPSNGYEAQIQNGFKDGDRTKPVDSGTGAIFRRTVARWVVPNDREWFTMTLIAHGPHFATWVNGLQVTDWTDERAPDPNPRRGQRLEAGHLSLQGHDPTTDLDFRNLRIATFPKPKRE